GNVQQVRAFTSGKNINPQWSPDGRALFFISDRDGIPNLYRVAIESGDVAQVTHVATGLSGITSSSPAMSVATKTGVAAFSVYEGGKYDIYVTDAENMRVVGRGALDEPTMGGRAGELPPLDRRQSEVVALLNDASFGLPPQTAESTYTVKD